MLAKIYCTVCIYAVAPSPSHGNVMAAILEDKLAAEDAMNIFGAA